MKIDLRDYFKAIRDAYGYDQAAFAERLGISRSYVACLEVGNRSPSLRVLYKLRVEFGLSIDDLLDKVEESTIPEI